MLGQTLLAQNQHGHTLRQVSVGPKLASGTGGEGTVYQDAHRPELVLKLFHEPSSRTREKIQAMLEHRPQHQLEHRGADTVVQIAWPLEILFIPDGRFIGFSMRRVDFNATVPLNAWFDRLSRSHNRLTNDDRIRLYLAHNLAAMVDYVHNVGHAVVDIKPENIRGYRDGGFICLLDCDGFRIKGGALTFPATVATRPYTAPEHLTGDWKPETFDRSQDEFGLAVMIFMLMNDGRHPSDGTSAGGPSDRAGRLAKGMVFLEPTSGLTAPSASQHEYFHPETLELFRRAFGPAASRPSSAEWRDHMRLTLQTRLVQCANDSEHWHYGFGCARCALDERDRQAKKSVQMAAPSVPQPSAPKKPAQPRPMQPSFPGGSTSSGAVPRTPAPGSTSTRSSAPTSGAKQVKVAKPRAPLPAWVRLFAWAVAGVALVAVFRYVSETQPPTAVAGLRPPAPAAAPAPAREPAPRTVQKSPFTATHSVAASQAFMRKGPSRASEQLVVLSRMTDLEEVEGSTADFVKIRTSDDKMGWMERTVVVTKTDASRLASLDPAAYIGGLASQGRGAKVFSQGVSSQGKLSELLALVAAHSPDLNNALDAFDARRRIEIDIDQGAGTWFYWSAEDAGGRGAFDAACLNANAAVEANPINPAYYRTAGLNCFYARKGDDLPRLAATSLYLAPKSATTWALLGIVLSQSDKDQGLAASAFALVNRFAPGSSGNTLLGKIERVQDARVNEAIARSRQEGIR